MTRAPSKLSVSSVLAACCLVLTASSATSLAEGWYAGIEGGYVEQTFKAHYEYRDGSTPDDYTDRGFGLAVSGVGGYRFPVFQRLDLSFQGRATAADAEWKLETDEPATLKYSIPWEYSFSLIPDIALTDRLSLFAEAGIGQGNVRLEKTSDTHSRYDADEWKTSRSVGAGLRCRISNQWHAFLQYRYTDYDEVSTTSHLPDGSPWEAIDTDSHSETFLAGLMYNFGR